jgi:DDE superfamily endonuclease/Helix-turn-helix of DDE superfamily endonuclease
MIEGQPPRSQRMTGLSQEQVDWLYEQVAAMVTWDAPLGRPRMLPLYTALVMVLFSLRHNLAEDACGELFGISTATVWRYQEELEPVIDQVLSALAEQIHCQAQREGALVDGFVAPVGDREDADDLYSGKKHLNGQNVRVVANLDGRVVDVGDPCPGAMHDSRAFTQSGIAERWAGHYAPGGPGMTGDKGYPGIGMITPDRKPPGGQLSAGQKAYNTSVNDIRAAVERAIAHLRSWKILKTGYRRIMRDFPDMLRTVTMLGIYRACGPTPE